MNLFKKEKIVNCPFGAGTTCIKDKCGIWITTDKDGMCSVSLVATSLKGICTLFKKSKSEISKYFEGQGKELGLIDMDNERGN